MDWQLHHPLQRNSRLTEKDSIALLYHDIFGYPLNAHEFKRWEPGERLKLRKARPKVCEVNGYYVISGKEKLVTRRLTNEFHSKSKIKILSFAKPIFEEDNNILMVGITGSLAMSSAGSNSDIDLMIVTQEGAMWKSRLQTLLALRRNKIKVRSSGDSSERDKLCLNMWLDSGNLKVEESLRNPYTAHEVAQVVPLVNKNNIYEEFIAVNRWVGEYWPKAVSVKNYTKPLPKAKPSTKDVVLEKLAYIAQKAYMSRKKTREVVGQNRAWFHPYDWSRRALAELESRGVTFT